MRRILLLASLALIGACSAAPTTPRTVKTAQHEDGPTCRGGYVIAYNKCDSTSTGN